MFEAFYHLSREPFRLSPDPRFCLGHRSYAKAKAYMQYAVQRGEGFIMITGRPGTGKTTLIEDILAGLSETQVVSARLNSAQLEADDLLRMVGFTFGVGVEGLDKASVLQRIERFVTHQAQMGRRALLVIDEAQALSSSALEELRLLSNLQADAKPLLQVFLVGQEPLRNVIRAPGMEQLHQRLIATCHLQPLDAHETRTYVEHRLRCAGWTGDPRISGGALLLIYRFSEGVPRRINLVASRLLLHGSVEERHELGGEDAREVVEELRDEALMPVGEGGDGDSEMFGDLRLLDSADVGVDLLPIPAVPETGEDRPCLVELNAESAAHAYPLSPGKTYVGRVPECAIVLKNNFTSRKHAEIEYCADGKLFVRDLGSRNGTWIEGRRIDEHLLSDGERIQFGSKSVFQVRIPGGAPVHHEPLVGTDTGEFSVPGEAHTDKDQEQHAATSPTTPIELGDRDASVGETLVAPWPEAQVSHVKSMLNGPLSSTSEPRSEEAFPVLTEGLKAGPEQAGHPRSKQRFPKAQTGSTAVRPAAKAVPHVHEPVVRAPPAAGDVRLGSGARRQKQSPESVRQDKGMGQGGDSGKATKSQGREGPMKHKDPLSGTRLGLYWLSLLVTMAAIFFANSQPFEPVRADLSSWVASRLDLLRPTLSTAGEGAPVAGRPAGGRVAAPDVTATSIPIEPPRVVPESTQAAFRTDY